MGFDFLYAVIASIFLVVGLLALAFSIKLIITGIRGKKSKRPPMPPRTPQSPSLDAPMPDDWEPPRSLDIGNRKTTYSNDSDSGSSYSSGGCSGGSDSSSGSCD